MILPAMEKRVYHSHDKKKKGKIMTASYHSSYVPHQLKNQYSAEYCLEKDWPM